MNDTTSTTTRGGIDVDALTEAFQRDGYVVVAGLFSDCELSALGQSLAALQAGVADGTPGSTRLR